MKGAIVALALLAVASAATVSGNEPVPIISQDSEVNFDGSYRSSFQAGNGISAQEQGVLKNAGQKDAEAEEVQGSFEYTAPDGTPVQVQYVANENGFQPQGSHLPVAPPVPEYIQRSLEWTAKHHPEEAQKQKF